jgi:hypothetical protein
MEDYWIIKEDYCLLHVQIMNKENQIKIGANVSKK